MYVFVWEDLQLSFMDRPTLVVAVAKNAGGAAAAVKHAAAALGWDLDGGDHFRLAVPGADIYGTQTQLAFFSRGKPMDDRAKTWLPPATTVGVCAQIKADSDALQTILGALEHLPGESIRRVLDTAATFYGVGLLKYGGE